MAEIINHVMVNNLLPIAIHLSWLDVDILTVGMVIHLGLNSQSVVNRFRAKALNSAENFNDHDVLVFHILDFINKFIKLDLNLF